MCESIQCIVYLSMNKYEIKENLFQTCQADIDQRINSIQEVLASIEESRNNETKSSVGDKYETGRSMMQLEEQKSRQQLFQANQVRLELIKIDIKRQTDKVEIGSLVETTSGNYFISVGIGKVRMDDILYYCISSRSPIGMKLMYKEKGDEIEFNGKKTRISGIH